MLVSQPNLVEVEPFFFVQALSFVPYICIVTYHLSETRYKTSKTPQKSVFRGRAPRKCPQIRRVGREQGWRSDERNRFPTMTWPGL